MRKLVVFTLLSVFLSSVGNAGSISNLIPGSVNRLEDNNFEVGFAANGDQLDPGGDITVGSKFLGGVRVQEWENGYIPGNFDSTFTGLFGIEVAAIGTSTNGDTSVYFKPLGVSNWGAEFGLNDFFVDNVNTMFVAFDDVLAGVPDGSVGALQDAFNSFVGSNKIYEFGFEGSEVTLNNGGITTDDGEFFVAEGPNSDVVGGVDVSDLDNLRNVISLSVLGRFNGAPELADHDELSGSSIQGRALQAGVSFADANSLQAFGTVDNVDAAGAMPIETDTDLFVKPVPEPSSLAIFTIAGIGLLGMRSRRRKNSAS